MNWLTLANAVINIGLNNRGFLTGLAQTQLRMVAFTSSVTSQANNMQNALRTALVVGGVGGGVGGLTGVMISAASWAEQAEARLEHFLGSTREARRMLRELTEFASNTQFDLPGAANAAQKLMNAGFAADTLMPKLQALADTAAILGTGQFGFDRMVYAISQIGTSNTLKASEMRQLTEALVPAWRILAKEMGVSKAQLADMITNREVGGMQAVKLLFQGLEKEYGGGTERMLQTVGGKWGKFKDDLYILFMELGQVLAPFVRTLLDNMTYLINQLTEMVRDWGTISEFVFRNFGDLWNYATADIQKNIAIWTAVFQHFGNSWDSTINYMIKVFRAAFDYMFDILRTFFENAMSWGKEWIESFGESITQAFKDLQAGKLPAPGFKDFNPETKAMPEFHAPELPKELQNLIRSIEAAFDTGKEGLLDKLAKEWFGLEFGKEGEEKDPTLDEGMEGLGKDRKAQIIGIEELWRKNQLAGLDPVEAAVKKAGDQQVAAINEVRDGLIAVKEEVGKLNVGLA